MSRRWRRPWRPGVWQREPPRSALQMGGTLQLAPGWPPFSRRRRAQLSSCSQHSCAGRRCGSRQQFTLAQHQHNSLVLLEHPCACIQDQRPCITIVKSKGPVVCPEEAQCAKGFGERRNGSTWRVVSGRGWGSWAPNWIPNSGGGRIAMTGALSCCNVADPVARRKRKAVVSYGSCLEA